jgi:hypothetical protein
MFEFLASFFTTSNNDIIKNMDNNPEKYAIFTEKEITNYSKEYVVKKDREIYSNTNTNTNKEINKMSETIKVDNQVDYFGNLANSAFGLINGYYSAKTDYNNSKKENTQTNNKQNEQEIIKETSNNNNNIILIVGGSLLAIIFTAILIKKV